MAFKITPELARIHAHVCGDGCVYLRNDKRNPGSLKKHPRKNLYFPYWTIEYSNTCRELLEEFREDMRTSFNRNCSSSYRNRVRYKGVFHIINKLELKNKNSKNWGGTLFYNEFIKESYKKLVKSFF